MRLPHNSNNLAYVRSLRKNMTDAERKLWYEYLRPCPYKFTRQKSVGPYILDFYCASAQLAVEIDGSQHYEPQGQQQDAARTAYLQAFGIFVLAVFQPGTFFSIWMGVAAESLSVRF